MTIHFPAHTGVVNHIPPYIAAIKNKYEYGTEEKAADSEAGTPAITAADIQTKDEEEVLDAFENADTKFYNALSQTLKFDLRRRMAQEIKWTSGLRAWAWIKQEVMKKNHAFFTRVERRIKERRLQKNHDGDMYSMLTEFISDFDILETSGRNKFSVESKIAYVRVACASKLDGDGQPLEGPYETAFTLIIHSSSQDSSYSFEQACNTLKTHYDSFHDPNSKGLMLGATSKASDGKPSAESLNFSIDLKNPMAGVKKILNTCKDNDNISEKNQNALISFGKGGFKALGKGGKGGGRGKGQGGPSYYGNPGGKGKGGKGKGGKGGKGYTAYFNGECNNCGKWGHKAVDCYSKKRNTENANLTEKKKKKKPEDACNTTTVWSFVTSACVITVVAGANASSTAGSIVKAHRERSDKACKLFLYVDTCASNNMVGDWELPNLKDFKEGDGQIFFGDTDQGCKILGTATKVFELEDSKGVVRKLEIKDMLVVRGLDKCLLSVMKLREKKIKCDFINDYMILPNGTKFKMGVVDNLFALKLHFA